MENKIVFLVIGAHAVLAYTNYRLTSDLDILVSRSKGNARKFATALNTRGISCPEGRWEDMLTKKGKRLAIPDSQNSQIDILTSIDDIDFGKCYEESKEIIFGNLMVNIPSLLDLIKMKLVSRASGNDEASHQKDDSDIEELRKLI